MEENTISEENIISDEKLLKFYTHENLEEMTNLFSNGNFSEIINKFFLVAPRSDSVNSNLSERNQSASSEKENPNPSANNNISKNTNNNLPGNADTNNNSNQNPSNIMFSAIINTPQSAIQSPYPSMSQRNSEFNYNIFEKLNEDELTQQILLTIVLYCLLKRKNPPDEVKTLIEKYNYPHCDMIFPLIMLKAKFFIKTKNIPKAIDILNEAIFLYEDYKSHLEEKKNDLKNIYTIETFHQKFKYS
jgi:hypothetical protein